jgi:hypothetical protein
MSHLEDLLCEFYDRQGYIVRRNVHVGRLKHGGWQSEPDIVAYHPKTGDWLHLEPSIDAHPWSRRQERFRKKFHAGKQFMFSDVFPWLNRGTPLKQIAVLVTRGADPRDLAGGEVIAIDEILREMRSQVAAVGKVASTAIPEQYRLLRTVQMVDCGYYRRLE